MMEFSDVVKANNFWLPWGLATGCMIGGVIRYPDSPFVAASLVLVAFTAPCYRRMRDASKDKSLEDRWFYLGMTLWGLGVISWLIHIAIIGG